LSSACAALLILAALASAALASTARPASALTLAPVDGGRNYYARFSDSLRPGRSYFPIGVWFEGVRSHADVAKDKAAGLNTYVVLTEDSNLGLVQSAHMRAILQSDSFGPHPAINGWFLADEVDMTHGPSAGYDEMRRVNEATSHDGRLRYANYGKGVLFWESDAEAARFVNDFQDIVSADAYWFTDENICQGSEGGTLLADGAPLSPADCHRAANYGATVRRVRGLVNPLRSKPVWAYVELGHPFDQSDWPTITPPQVRAAVWQSLIAGARGIVYFNQSFGGPHQTFQTLRDGSVAGSFYAPIRATVTAVNHQITALAPVLNAPTVISGWSQGPGTTAMVKWVKGGKTRKRPRMYVFAGSAGSSVDGRFSLRCVGDTSAEVVGERRRVRVRNGSFRDHFADGNTIHIYRIEARSRCGPPRKQAATAIDQPGWGHRARSSNSILPVVLTAAALVILAASASLGFTRRAGQEPRRGTRSRRTRRLRTR
jgi:hypothetical protein